MKQNINIEAEGSELVLKNKAGDYVIIPKKYRAEVQGMIEDGCHSCIDSLVETLPIMADYAEDGSLLPEDKKKITFKYEPYTAVQDNTYVAPKVIVPLEQKKKQQFTPREQPVIKADTRTEQQRKIDQDYTESVLNPSIITQIGEAFQNPLRWLADPLKGVGDIVSAIAPNSTLAKDLPNTHEDVFEYRKKQLNPYTSGKEKLNNAINETAPLSAWAMLNTLPVEIATGNMIKSGKNLIKPASKVLNKTDDVVKTAASSVDDIKKSVKPAWKMQELPGLHLKSTMEGEAISKIVEPKTGLINTEQALAIIAKESGGADKVALIRRGLGNNIPKKMDYNEFRKTVQDQLIPLEQQFSTHRSSYGISNLGYKDNIVDPKRLKDWQETLLFWENKLKKAKKTEDIEFAKKQVDSFKKDIARWTDGTPLENQTLILSNKGKFGRGSSAHGNPEETLGHIHFLRDAETPDVLTVTQIQSDAFQGTHRIMPKTQQEALEKVNKLKEEWVEIKSMFGDGKESSNAVLANYEKHLQLDEASAKNFTQKQLLDKNHQERYLQELVDYAGKRGDINKVRVPTSETAAKVQGYSVNYTELKKVSGYGDETINEIVKLKEKGLSTDEAFNLMIKKYEGKYTKTDFDRFKDFYKMDLKPSYSSEHQTILKKYSEQPKTIKKLFGVEPKIVTDSKGNTWYEFDIPKKFKEGKGEIKAFGLIPPAIGVGTAIQSQQNKTK